MGEQLLALHYLPDVYWWARYLQGSRVWVEHCENFVKATARNRCTIATAAGPHLLSIPIEGGRDHHQLYRDTRIDYHYNWQKSHWHTLTAAYRSTPFFEHYAPVLEPFYQKPVPYLFDYNLQLTEALKKLLKTPQSHELTQQFEKHPGNVADCRYIKKETPHAPLTGYYQIFAERHGFLPGLSVVDLLFNTGPQATAYLLQLKL